MLPPLAPQGDALQEATPPDEGEELPMSPMTLEQERDEEHDVNQEDEEDEKEEEEQEEREEEQHDDDEEEDSDTGGSLVVDEKADVNEVTLVPKEELLSADAMSFHRMQSSIYDFNSQARRVRANRRSEEGN